MCAVRLSVKPVNLFRASTGQRASALAARCLAVDTTVMMEVDAKWLCLLLKILAGRSTIMTEKVNIIDLKVSEIKTSSLGNWAQMPPHRHVIVKN